MPKEVFGGSQTGPVYEIAPDAASSIDSSTATPQEIGTGLSGLQRRMEQQSPKTLTEQMGSIAQAILQMFRNNRPLNQ